MIPWKTYRKKPVLIDAFRFTSAMLADEDLVSGLEGMGILPVKDKFLIMDGDRGDLVAREGDWVIIDADDQISTCTDKKFREAYQGK